MAESSSPRLILVSLAIFLVVFGNICDGQTICNVPTSGLAQCRPAVTPPRPTKPTQGCCSSIKNADFKCLCRYRSALPSLGIDLNLVLQLPKKCNINKSINCS